MTITYNSVIFSIVVSFVMAKGLSPDPFKCPVLNFGAETSLIIGKSLVLSPGNYMHYEWQNRSANSTYQVERPSIYWLKVSDLYSEARLDSD